MEMKYRLKSEKPIRVPYIDISEDNSFIAFTQAEQMFILCVFHLLSLLSAPVVYDCMFCGTVLYTTATRRIYFLRFAGTSEEEGFVSIVYMLIEEVVIYNKFIR